jgi:hypothetical protein
MHRVHPGHHVPAARGPSASADDESSHGSASELPPATSHGLAEWDTSGVPDPVMFRRFLDAMDYWFGYSDDSSAGSYDPTWECCVVITNDQENTANAPEAGDGEVPPGLGTGPRQGTGPSAPPSSLPRGPTSMRSWLKRASLKPNSRRSTARCDCFEPPSPGKPPRAEYAHVSWAGKPASASTPTSTSTTRPCERAKSSLPLRRCYGPCRPPHSPRRETCTTRHKCSLSKRPFNRPKARRLASSSRGARKTTGALKAPSHQYTREP